MNHPNPAIRCLPFALAMFGAIALAEPVQAPCKSAGPDNPCAPGDGSGARSECRLEMMFTPMPSGTAPPPALCGAPCRFRPRPLSLPFPSIGIYDALLANYLFAL